MIDTDHDPPNPGASLCVPDLCRRPQRWPPAWSPWGRSGGTLAYIWNQAKDKAYLRNVSGALVDSCAYNSSRQDYKIC
ncbi:UNVERIFIED_ORG: hypothetical protein FHR35_004005 [Microbispora rosea subsp. rosea]